MRICSKCKKEKPLLNFSKGRTECKPCRKIIYKIYYDNNKEKCLLRNKKARTKNRDKHIEYKRNRRRSKDGKLKVMYAKLGVRSKQRNHLPPNFTYEEFKEWAYKNNYEYLYNKWVESGYSVWEAPSPDRLDNSGGYFLDRMRLVKWIENKATYEQRNYV